VELIKDVAKCIPVEFQMPARSVSVIYSELNTIFGCCEFSFPD
jgi:hypothetical protein